MGKTDKKILRERKKDNTKTGCPYQKKCGGCQWTELPYQEQLARKQKKVERLLKPYGKVLPIAGMEQPEHYRNKVHAVAGYDRKKGVITGTYEARSHRIVAIENCLLENETAGRIIATIRSLLPSFKIKTYDEDKRYGLLRHILIRVGEKSGEIMVVLVTSSPQFPSKRNFTKALLQKHPEITTIVQNINPDDTSMVLGKRDVVLYGKGYIEDVLCGKRFKISPQSFYQVNAVQTELLYTLAIKYAGLNGKETVLDAYCGIGTIGLIAGEHAGRVIGVELNPEAVRDAIQNKYRNQAENVEFYQGDAGKFLTEMVSASRCGADFKKENQAMEKIDVVFMDPPRSGSSREFLHALITAKPEKIVYVSCNPETLARDLEVLTKKGYRMVKARPVDMFPFTDCVETVVLLSKGEIDSKKVRVEFSLEDMDMSDFQDKATYTQIKDYVLEHSGLKVSNLYISQIKRKCGLEVGKNYNLPKAEDSRQPQCPSEKENAIREAMKYFGMI